MRLNEYFPFMRSNSKTLQNIAHVEGEGGVGWGEGEGEVEGEVGFYGFNHPH